MRLTLLHPPHTAIGSRVPKENLPPFGLLCIGGPLIDAGHEVRQVNADPKPMRIAEIVVTVLRDAPEAVLIGHSGSTSAQPTVVRIAQALRRTAPGLLIVYGGVYPTYHWREILAEVPEIDVIVRGEGEVTAPALIAALAEGRDLATIPGIAFRKDGVAHATSPAPMLKDLDSARIGWELIDFARHSCWGGKRAVIMQFSRGCPHLCTYCGQRRF